MQFADKHIEYMKLALDKAKKAFGKNEVPVGAIIVKNDKVISEGFNSVENDKNSLKHAEIIAIEKALSSLNSKYLDDCTLYCTLEPCIMCAGAMINSKLSNLVFGAMDLKCGASGSRYYLLTKNDLNHSVNVVGGVLEKECSDLMSNFFNNIRKSK